MSGREVVLVAAVRSPFAPEGGALAGSSVPELGATVVAEAILRAGLRPGWVGAAVVGVARAPLAATNPAREIAVRAGLSPRAAALTVSAADASGELAVITAIERIALGRIDLAVAGGVESASDAATRLPRAAIEAVDRLHRARAPRDKLRALASLRSPGVEPPAELEGTLTGWTPGQAAEAVAKRHHLGRLQQDRWAVRSHAGAIQGERDPERGVGPIPVPVDAGGRVRIVDHDDGPRTDVSLATLAGLRPAHDRDLGTVTVGNGAAAADGASAVVLAAGERARAEGWPILARVRGWSTTGDDPFDAPWGGAAAAIADVLERVPVTVDELAVVEMHEPWAAVVLATLARLASPTWAARWRGRGDAVIEIDPERVNAWGGSIAFGHPAAATGGRLLAMAAGRMKAGDGALGLVATGTAGGQGAAILLGR